MSKERKKVAQKPIKKAEPKKRDEPLPKPKPVAKGKKKIVKEVVIVPEPIVVSGNFMKNETPKPKSTDKYVRLATNASPEKRKEINDKVIKHELQLAYYAIDNEVGYHYYLVTK